MCGIVGIWHRQSQKKPEAAVLRRMRDALVHRGPNDAGEFFDGNLALGHRRLSILDLSSAGHQPMTTPDGRYTIVFNGEIYNYKELQRQYVAGIPLVSQSDTEVLLHLLAREGKKALPLLKGMFALALWDTQQQELLLACDPFGKKPLYYAVYNGDVFFASEIKAFKAYSEHLVELNSQDIPSYFLHEYAPSGQSLYKHIQALPMGHYAIVRASSLSIHPWWKPSFHPKKRLLESAALKQLDTLLSQAVSRRLVSDVPVGIFLSGGLDSTTLLWYMRDLGVKDIHSCSVSFTDQSFDESSYIHLAQSAFSTTHHDVRFDENLFFETLPEIVEAMDTPLADASFLPTYAVSKEAKKYMTVVLSGEGSDELFGGYGTFQAGELAEYLSFIPPFLWQKLFLMSSLLPVSHQYFSWDFKIKSFLKGMPYPLPSRNQVWLGSFTPTELRQCLTRELQAHMSHMFDSIKAVKGNSTNLSPFDAISYLTIEHYLQHDILVKLDRATMLASIEGRTPFLDVDLAEFIMKLPPALKRNKYLLKRLMTGRIPETIITRSKKGFGIPLGAWFQGPLQAWLKETLSPEKIAMYGFFEESSIERLIQEHVAGTHDHRKKLWTLSMFQLWLERWPVGSFLERT